MAYYYVVVKTLFRLFRIMSTFCSGYFMRCDIFPLTYATSLSLHIATSNYSIYKLLHRQQIVNRCNKTTACEKLADGINVQVCIPDRQQAEVASFVQASYPVIRLAKVFKTFSVVRVEWVVYRYIGDTVIDILVIVVCSLMCS